MLQWNALLHYGSFLNCTIIIYTSTYCIMMKYILQYVFANYFATKYVSHATENK